MEEARQKLVIGNQLIYVSTLFLLNLVLLCG